MINWFINNLPHYTIIYLTIYIYIYIHTYIHTYIHIHIHVHPILICLSVCLSVFQSVYLYNQQILILFSRKGTASGFEPNIILFRTNQISDILYVSVLNAVITYHVFYFSFILAIFSNSLILFFLYLLKT